ncbi:acyl-CoA dehydrogenase family protein [Streptomyces sp. NPDC005820]|uniref:acyl-CoA dehydrogenase family protein n=1 Tax=Streptomyces sp. NPDC005820 TaxID=3157069 RepID=UPI0033EFE95F
MPTVPRTQDRVSHDVWLPAETIEVRERARKAVTTHLAPYAREIGQRTESPESFPWAAFRGLAAEGLFAVPFDAEYGAGLEHPMLATCTVAEEIAYESSSMAGVYDGQCILVPQTLTFAKPEVQARLIPELVSGATAFSFATTEPETSSDLTAERLSTVAERTATGFVISGRKRWITNSVVAGWVSVLCRDGKNGGRATMLLVDLTSPGVTIGSPDLKMGHRGQITADIVFEDVEVPANQVLWEAGQGMRVALSALVRGRIGIGAAGVGLAQAALDLAVERLRSRHVFGAPLGAMQHWQFTMAKHATDIEAARSLYQKAALLLDKGHSAEPEAAMAKAYGTRVANDIVRDAIQIHGALGFARQVGATGESVRLEEMYRDAKILEIFEGANELQHWIVARHLIGRDVTG